MYKTADMADLVLPTPSFLSLLKEVGAEGKPSPKGELFTIKQLCYFLKEYIKHKALYDFTNPLVVNCEHDPLGAVFARKSFTFHEAMHLASLQTQPTLPLANHTPRQQDIVSAQAANRQMHFKGLLSTPYDEGMLEKPFSRFSNDDNSVFSVSELAPTVSFTSGCSENKNDSNEGNTDAQKNVETNAGGLKLLEKQRASNFSSVDDLKLLDKQNVANYSSMDELFQSDIVLSQKHMAQRCPSPPLDLKLEASDSELDNYFSSDKLCNLQEKQSLGKTVGGSLPTDLVDHNELQKTPVKQIQSWADVVIPESSLRSENRGISHSSTAKTALNFKDENDNCNGEPLKNQETTGAGANHLPSDARRLSISVSSGNKLDSLGKEQKPTASTIPRTCSSFTRVEVYETIPSTSGLNGPSTKTKLSKSAAEGSTGQSKPLKLEKSSSSGSNSSMKSGTAPSQRVPTPTPKNRTRQSSFSIVCTDKRESSGAYPWYFRVDIEDDSSEEVHSVQSKETVLVQDSSDDMWFLDGELENDNSDSNTQDQISVQMDQDGISVEIQSAQPRNDDDEELSDPPFDEEYEPASEVEEDKSKDGEDLDDSVDEEIVISVDSPPKKQASYDRDIEFWADSESSDTNESSDEDLTDQDKWTCGNCDTVNSPLRRYCDLCWQTRSGWLPERGCAAITEPSTDHGSLPVDTPSTAAAVVTKDGRGRNKSHRGRGKSRVKKNRRLDHAAVKRYETMPFTVTSDLFHSGDEFMLSGSQPTASQESTKSAPAFVMMESDEELEVYEYDPVSGRNVRGVEEVNSEAKLSGLNSYFPEGTAVKSNDSSTLDFLGHHRYLDEQNRVGRFPSASSTIVGSRQVSGGDVQSLHRSDTNETLPASDINLEDLDDYLNSQNHIESEQSSQPVSQLCASDSGVGMVSQESMNPDSQLRDEVRHIITDPLFDDVKGSSQSLHLAISSTPNDEKSLQGSSPEVDKLCHMKRSNRIQSPVEIGGERISHLKRTYQESNSLDNCDSQNDMEAKRVKFDISSDASRKRIRKASETYSDLCQLCFVNQKEASIIHGKTAHQMCCYPCAKRLRRHGKPCPVCRRPIQRVVKNFLV